MRNLLIFFSFYISTSILKYLSLEQNDWTPSWSIPEFTPNFLRVIKLFQNSFLTITLAIFPPTHTTPKTHKWINTAINTTCQVRIATPATTTYPPPFLFSPWSNSLEKQQVYAKFELPGWFDPFSLLLRNFRNLVLISCCSQIAGRAGKWITPCYTLTTGTNGFLVGRWKWVQKFPKSLGGKRKRERLGCKSVSNVAPFGEL